MVSTDTPARPGRHPGDQCLLAEPPLSLYVHLPWCIRKCPYCDFNSHPLKAPLPAAAYVDALLVDLGEELTRVPGRRLETVFLGGGTPSLFPAEQLGRLLGLIRSDMTCAPDLEVTLEANPGAVEHDRFEAYLAAGINRLSLGAQSFDDTLLDRLGRVHAAAEIETAVVAARRAGFENINLDLMYGLPGQHAAAAADDLRRALDLGPTHLSHYQLTLEPGTAFHARPPALPDEEEVELMLDRCQALLAEADFQQYEVSAYARPDSRCRHNLNYWRFGDYLGLGAGAHGKLTDRPGGRVLRRVKQSQPRRYMSAAGSGGRLGAEHELGPGDLVFEYMMNRVRVLEEITVLGFERYTGLPREVLDEPLHEASNRGFLEGGGGRWRVTPLGWRFLNDLQALFLPG